MYNPERPSIARPARPNVRPRSSCADWAVTGWESNPRARHCLGSAQPDFLAPLTARAPDTIRKSRPGERAANRDGESREETSKEKASSVVMPGFPRRAGMAVSIMRLDRSSHGWRCTSEACSPFAPSGSNCRLYTDSAWSACPAPAPRPNRSEVERCRTR